VLHLLRSIANRNLLVLLVLVVVFSLAACSSGNNNTGSESSNGGENTSVNSTQNESDSGSTENEEEVVELTFWNIWVNDQSKPHLDQVKAFEEAYPNIKINMETIPHDQYKIKVKTSAAGKQLPDIFQVWPGAELEPLVSAGSIQPIDSIVDHWKDQTIPADLLTAYQIDGKQYAIPGNQNYTHVIYYDKDQVAAAGFETFPETYEDFKQLITNLKDNNLTPIALGNKGKWVLQSCYMSTIGDRYTGNQFLEQALSGEAKFTDPAFIDALNVFKELADMEAFNSDMNNIDNNQQRDVFVQGKAAMFIEGSWAITDLVPKAPKDKNIGIAFFPTVEGGAGKPMAVSSVVGTGIGMNSKLTDAKKAAAEEFMKFFYSEEFYGSMMAAGIVVPANVPAPDDAPDLFKDFVEKAQSTTFAPVYDAVLPVQLTELINNGLQALTIEAVTPEQLAEDMEQENQAIMKKN
jgi:raffinose/stachyose/melibiose transport system substrate-binding protein